MNENNKYRKIIIIAGAILAAIVLVLFAAGKLDWLLSDESLTASDYPPSSPSISAADPSGSSETGSSDENSGSTAESSSAPAESQLRFRNKDLLNQHYTKHGIDMGFTSAEEYEKAAARVPYTPGVLHKIEAEDGDDVYYIESTNEFVVVSTDGYLRTYFNPDRGIDYFNRQ